MHRVPMLAARRAAFALALLVPAAAGAQIFKVGQRSQDPLFLGSLGVGLFQSQSVIDGTTESEWRLNDAVQYRGSLEWALRGGSAVGAVFTHARVPFRYVDANGALDADMTVQSLWGTFHGGGGQGLHGVLDAGLGYTWYRDFEAEEGDALDDVKPDQDFSFYFGTGFGFGITRRLSINLVQDFVFVRHQGEGLTNDERTTTQQRATRIGVRYGFGSRRAGI